MSKSKKESLLEGAKSISQGKKVRPKRRGSQKRRALSMDERLRKFYEESEPGRVYTLDEIGTAMGVTRERIRQIEQKALQKFYRHWTRIMKDDEVTIDQIFETLREARKGQVDEYDA